MFDERDFTQALHTLPARLLRTESLATIAGVLLSTYLVLTGTPAVEAVSVTLPFVALVLGRSYHKGMLDQGAAGAADFALTRVEAYATATGNTRLAKAADAGQQVIEAATEKPRRAKTAG